MATPDPADKAAPDEIDLGHFFNLIYKVFHSMFIGILTFYQYVKRNFVWFVGLTVIGAIAGFTINQLVDEKHKLDVLVRPSKDDINFSFDTRTYLYDVLTEIHSDIKGKDSLFFDNLGFKAEDLPGLEIEITPLISEGRGLLDTENDIISALMEFQNSEAVNEMLESELRNEAMIDQRITFYFKDPVAGEKFAKKTLEYINSNPYYDNLVEVQRQNNKMSLMSNDSLINQIDLLLQAFTDKLNKTNSGSEGQIVMENLTGMNAAALLELKTELLADSDIRRMELEMNDRPVNILNFGKPHKIDKPLFKKNIVFFPLLLLGLFLAGSFIRFLNRKSKELL